MKATIKKVGNFEIYYNDNYNNVFRNHNIKYYVLRDGITYGAVFNDGTIQKQYFYNYAKDCALEIKLNKRLHDRLCDLWIWGNDKRIDKLMSEFVSSYNDDLYLIFYHDYNLK
jgi:hypothetical protein